MEQFFAYQKDSRTPCKYGRKCFQKNKEHLDKYKHPPTKEDVKVDTKKIAKKRDSRGKVKLENTNRNGESSSVNGHNSNDNFPQDENDMEVPEQLNDLSDSEPSTSRSNDEQTESITNQQNIMNIQSLLPSRQRSQQQQLLLTNNALEDCSGDDGIVPSTPTLLIPRRLDGETVSSPHVPSGSQGPRFTFLGTSQNSHVHEVVSENALSDFYSKWIPIRLKCASWKKNDEIKTYEFSRSEKFSLRMSRFMYSNDGEQSVSSERVVVSETVINSTYWNTQISKLFLVGDMPEEFYNLWSFCKRQNPTHPEDTFLSVGLKLVGPYDVLAGHFNEFCTNKEENAVLHWRYYYDPPEFQTIISSTNGSQYHIGYFRDEPLAVPVFVASNDSDKSCVIQNLGQSLFQALRKYLHTKEGDVAHSLQKKLYAFEKRKVKKILEGRQGTPVAKTFHKAGIFVPYDRKTDIGYRPLSEPDSVLRKIFKFYREASENKKVSEMDKLLPIINYANIATDECDFGTGLELGIDIFCDGNPDLHRICKQLLVTSYNLLRRPQFATIIQAHLNNRRKDGNMSIL